MTAVAQEKDDGRFLGPFPGQQTKFFLRTEREVFYGGAGGGGKSLCGQGKFGQQLAVERKRYQAGEIAQSKCWGIYLRRTMPDLQQAIERSHLFFKDIDPDADYNINDHLWTIPSCGNAKFQFGHMENEKSKYKYKSSEYCSARGTRVLMDGGFWRPIENIEVGDVVMTLEGGRKVVATYATGRKPCVRATSVFQGVTVGTQVFPTTHPVLLWPTDGLPLSPSRETPRGIFRSRPHGLLWQDVESLLDGRPESPVTRVSRVDEESCFEASDGSRRELSRLLPLTVPAALHGSSVRLAMKRYASATGCDVFSASPGPSDPSLREASQLHEVSDRDRERIAEVVQPGTLGIAETPVACDATSERTGSERRSGSLHDCPSCFCSHDGPFRTFVAAAQERARLPGDAETRIPNDSHRDATDGIQERIRQTPSSYPHFYTGDVRQSTEEVLRGEVSLEWAGWHETFDLTVYGANHYITDASIVNAQTYVFFDELTEFTETMYEYMDTRLRTTDPALEPMLQLCSASNPDGPGLLWVRRRFIEGKEPEVIYRRPTRLRDGRIINYDSIFIPAKLEDNPVLMRSGSYEASLLNKRPEVREAILHGNWYINPGAFLANIWDTKFHVVPNHPIPKGSPIVRSCDPGIGAPSSVTWYYVDRNGGLTGVHNLYLKNHDASMLASRIREVEEYYGWWSAESEQSPLYGPMDEDAFNRNLSGGPSYAKVMAECGVRWKRSRKDRFNGAAEIVRRLQARVKDIDGEVKPLVRWMERCKAPIETLPVLQSDPNDPNDVDTKGEDHCWDELMYQCLDRVLPRKDQEDDDDDIVDINEYRRRGSGGGSSGGAMGTPPGGW